MVWWKQRMDAVRAVWRCLLVSESNTKRSALISETLKTESTEPRRMRKIFEVSMRARRLDARVSTLCQLIHLSMHQSACVCHFCPPVWQRDNAEPWRSRLRLLLWLLVLGLLWERWIEGNSSLWVRGLGLQTCSSPVWDFALMPDT